MDFSARGDLDHQFQIAPMIDIVFILLIFFIATYATAQEEKLLDIQLPTATGGKDEARSLREIVVNLSDKSEIFVNRRRYALPELEARLRKLSEFAADPGVIIRADGSCAHRHVVQIMDLCARCKIRRVFFTATPPPEAGGAHAE